MSPFCFIRDDQPVGLPVLKQPLIRTDFIAVDEGVRSPDFTIAAVMPLQNPLRPNGKIIIVNFTRH